MRPITITGVQLRRSGEHIDDHGRWAPMVTEWSEVLSDDTQIQRLFDHEVRDLAVIEERADYRNWVIEARYVSAPVAVEEVGDVELVLDQGRFAAAADIVVDAEIIDEPIVHGLLDAETVDHLRLCPWLVERIAGQLTCSPIRGGVFGVVLAPLGAPRDEIIALLDEQLS